MPPKRKAATSKVKAEAEVDLVAGDQSESSAPKLRKRKIDDKEKQGKVEEKERKTAGQKKLVAAKVTEIGGGETENITEKKKYGRGKKTAEANGEKSDIIDESDINVTKRRGRKGDNTNGTLQEKVTRQKKADPPAEVPKIKGRKKDHEEKVEKPGPSNSTVTKWDKIDFTCTKKNEEGQKYNLKISCWNIGGLKSWVKKDCLKFLDYEDPDILCLQETKCSKEKLPEEIKELKDYKQYWCASSKEGYAGVGLLTKQEPLKLNYGINISELDEDARCITAEYEDYYIICVYVPNAGRKLVTLPKRLEWNKAFQDYVRLLDDNKPIIICGDMNVAHNEIDLARPANNTKNAGFTRQEREGLTEFLQDGYIDTFRKLYPEKTDMYTFWTYIGNARAKNVGWRLDYFIVSERIMGKVCDSVIRSEVLGSDHCPVTLFINI